MKKLLEELKDYQNKIIEFQKDFEKINNIIDAIIKQEEFKNFKFNVGKFVAINSNMYEIVDRYNKNDIKCYQLECLDDRFPSENYTEGELIRALFERE